jgi:hypothetical protein
MTFCIACDQFRLLFVLDWYKNLICTYLCNIYLFKFIPSQIWYASSSENPKKANQWAEPSNSIYGFRIMEHQFGLSLIIIDFKWACSVECKTWMDSSDYSIVELQRMATLQVSSRLTYCPLDRSVVHVTCAATFAPFPLYSFLFRASFHR